MDLARSTFEPNITGSCGHTRADLPPQNTNEGGAGEVLTVTGDNWSIGAEKRFSTGTNLSLEFRNNRSKSSAANAVAPINYRSSAEMRVTQPLFAVFPSIAYPNHFCAPG